MDAPTIIFPEFNNTTDARIYASKHFPQFSDVEFTKDDDDAFGRSATYHGEIGDKLLRVKGDGDVEYMHMDVPWTEVEEEDFPRDVARACSTAFLEDHGGIGPYEEANVYESGSYGTHGFDAIAAHTFVYHKRYDGYLIRGFDDIMTTVTPIGPMVAGCVWRERQYGIVNETRQVIPAEVAWWSARNATHNDIREDMHIDHVELCYYYERSYAMPTVLYPAWRFSGDVEIFVNAFTGDVMD